MSLADEGEETESDIPMKRRLTYDSPAMIRIAKSATIATARLTLGPTLNLRRVALTVAAGVEDEYSFMAMC